MPPPGACHRAVAGHRLAGPLERVGAEAVLEEPQSGVQPRERLLDLAERRVQPRREGAHGILGRLAGGALVDRLPGEVRDRLAQEHLEVPLLAVPALLGDEHAAPGGAARPGDRAPGVVGRQVQLGADAAQQVVDRVGRRAAAAHGALRRQHEGLGEPAAHHVDRFEPHRLTSPASRQRPRERPRRVKETCRLEGLEGRSRHHRPAPAHHCMAGSARQGHDGRSPGPRVDRPGERRGAGDPAHGGTVDGQRPDLGGPQVGEAPAGVAGIHAAGVGQRLGPRHAGHDQRPPDRGGEARQLTGVDGHRHRGGGQQRGREGGGGAPAKRRHHHPRSRREAPGQPRVVGAHGDDHAPERRIVDAPQIVHHAGEDAAHGRGDALAVDDGRQGSASTNASRRPATAS